MGSYAIYLRKSRADVEAEARGEGETLARHRAALSALADRAGYHVAHVYQEIVSGDTIAARPEMQDLLAAVQQGEYTGVICNDIDRLSRGDMIDQGTIQRAFITSGTLIITPGKIYDPRNDADSAYFEMGQFLARMEYKQIKKRLQSGRLRSAAEGNFQSGPAPYGYNKTRKPGGAYGLEPLENEAENVRLIFDWYCQERVGKNTIANRLNECGAKTKRGGAWTPYSVYVILRNRIYIGDYVYNRHHHEYTVENGKRKSHRTSNECPIVAENAFPPIVSRETWEKAQAILSGHVAPPKRDADALVNPLAGIVVCSECGHAMQRRVRGGIETLACSTLGCKTVGCYVKGVEKAILEGLEGWVGKYAAPDGKPAISSQNACKSNEIKQLKKRLEGVETQMKNLYGLLETGVYSPQEFIMRRAENGQEKSKIEARIAELESQPDESAQIVAMLPKIETVLDAYPIAATAAEKNSLLKSILAKVEYTKTFDARGRFKGDPAKYVKLRLFPRNMGNI